MTLRRPRLPESRLVRGALIVAFVGGVLVLLWWRGPDWADVGSRFANVGWEWVATAVGINLGSVFVRALAWRTVIDAAMPPPRPPRLLVFSAFCVGLFANVVLPGRVGELARVAVLARRLPKRPGTWPTLVGTVFAHRVFDLIPSLMLVVAVLLSARVPDWASTSLLAVLVVGVVLIAVTIALARRQRVSAHDSLGRVRQLLVRAQQGLRALGKPAPALLAALFQCGGWFLQLLAVYATMRAFHLHSTLAEAALVLVLINVATIVPLWPGNVGITQAAIAFPLHQYYGVPVGNGIAFGIGLQAIEASVGVGVGLVFLAREGLSFAMLRGIEMPEDADDVEEPPDLAQQPVRARIPE